MDDFEQPSATNEEKSLLLLLPYQGQKGDFALNSTRKRLKIFLPNNFNAQTAFKGKKLSSCFKILSILNINMILFIMESVLLMTVRMITLVKQVDALQKG